MKIRGHSFKDGAAIPGEFTFAVMDPLTHSSLSSNRNPHLAWTEVPDGSDNPHEALDESHFKHISANCFS